MESNHSLITKKNFEKITLAAILLCSSLLFVNTPGTTDVDEWLKLARNADTYGVVKGYAVTVDSFAHPPGMALFSFISTKAAASLGLSEFAGIKLSVYLFLLLSLIIIYLVTRNFYISIISYFLLVINSLGLVFLDIYFTPFLILSIFFLKKRNILLTTVFFALASMIKMQVIVVMPFFALQILNVNSLKQLKDIDYKNIAIKFILPYLSLYFAILFIYGKPFLLSFETAYKEDMLSGQGTNIGWITTFLLHLFSPGTYGSLGSTNFAIRMIRGDNVYFEILKYIFIVTYSIIFFAYFKQKDKSFEKFLLYTTAAFLSYFIVNKGVHENHLYIAVVMLLLLYGENKQYFIEMLIWGILFNINMFVFYGFDGRGFNRYDLTALQNPFTSYRVIKYLDLSLLFSFVCVVSYIVFIHKYILKKK